MQNSHGVATKAMAGVLLAAVLVFGGGPCIQAEEPAWWPGFCGPGVDALIWCSVVYEGRLIVGGSTLSFGGYPYELLAEWDGTRWWSVGAEFNGNVLDLCVYDGQLIAAGDFTEFGGDPINRIAAWNGEEWTALGTGFNDMATTLVVDGDDLLVTGYFTSAGGQAASRLARWDGATWSACAGELNAPVLGVARYDGDLIVSGEFTNAGPDSANYVARWTGLDWEPLGESANDWASELIEFEGELLACGYFTEIGGVTANRVAAWDGTEWSPLGSGMLGYGSCAVYGLEPYSDGMIAYGNFSSAGGIDLGHIAYWNGVAWESIDADHGPITTVTPWGGGLFAGGFNQYYQGLVLEHVSYWTGEEWQQLGHGLVCDSPEESFVRRMLVYGDQLVMIGGFSQGDMIRSKYIITWDGDGWIDMYGEELVEPGLDCLTTCQGELIIGGRFANFWGNPQTGLIVAWDGAVYHELGAGLDGGAVLAACKHDGDLYAGGYITGSGSGEIDNLAIWNGTTWQNAYGGLNAAVRSLVSHQGSLYVGGWFTAASYVPANYIARLDGASWHALGGGLNGYVSCLAEYNDQIIVGGEFTEAGGVPANHIAAWDPVTETWSPLGDGLVVTGDMPVEDMLVVADRLYVCGRFSEAGGIPVSNVAYWDGSSWHALEGQPNGAVLGLGYYQDELYLGGEFTAIGDIRSHFVARWDGFPTSDLPSADPAATVLHLAPCRPNPLHGHTAIRFELPAATAVDVGVYDVLGRKVRTLGTGTMLPGEHAMRWDGRSDVGHAVESGIYYIHLETPGESESKSVTVVR